MILPRSWRTSAKACFLWVNLQKDELLRSLNNKKLEQAVQTMPSGLERAYKRNRTAILQSRDDRRSRALGSIRTVPDHSE